MLTNIPLTFTYEMVHQKDRLKNRHDDSNRSKIQHSSDAPQHSSWISDKIQLESVQKYFVTLFVKICAKYKIFPKPVEGLN